ncbi:MAG: type 12 methyltransferase [Parcubacteria group bacterium Gr01-1014_44]|nr:MAG: type 12 methyltransferase [Parcubacteria group bacterium Gr01-1014_44]
MTSIQDDRGYNQGFKDSLALHIRTGRRGEAILKEFKTLENIKVLEIGCGTGELADRLAKKIQGQVIATDLCRPFIEKARHNFSHSGVIYEVKDFNKEDDLKWLQEQGPFDYIIGDGILHHLYDKLDLALANLNLLLKKGGRIVFWEPNIWNPYCRLIFKVPVLRKLAHLEPQEMAFGKRFIDQKLKKASFDDRQISYRDFLLPNTPAPLVNTLIATGNFMEKIPLLNMLSQSVLISARKKGSTSNLEIV